LHASLDFNAKKEQLTKERFAQWDISALVDLTKTSILALLELFQVLLDLCGRVNAYSVQLVIIALKDAQLQ